MHTLSRSILAFCLAIVTVCASGCIAVTAVPLPTQTSIPSQTPTDIPTPFFTKTPSPTVTILPDALTPTPVPEFGWSILFKYDFEENYWIPGKHSYRIIANCPDTEYFGDIDTSVAFIVDNDAYLWPSSAVIEFSYNYIGVKWDGYDFFPGSFQPQQKSRILFGYGRLSLEQVNQAITECQIRAIIDGKIKLKLLPGDPTPRDYDFGVDFRDWGW